MAFYYMIDFQWLDGNFNIFANKRVMVTGCRLICGQLHRNRARLHKSFGSRFIWQRRNCDFCITIYVLPLGEIRKNWLRILGCNGRTLIFLHGFSMGRLRIHYQFNPIACVCIVAHGTLFTASIHQLHNVLHFGFAILHANSVCRFPTDSNQWTHGGIWCVCPHYGCRGVETFTNRSIEARIQKIIHHRWIGGCCTCLCCRCSIDLMRSKWKSNLCYYPNQIIP